MCSGGSQNSSCSAAEELLKTKHGRVCSEDAGTSLETSAFVKWV